MAWIVFCLLLTDLRLSRCPARARQPAMAGPLGQLPGLIWDGARQRYFAASAASAAQGDGAGDSDDRERHQKREREVSVEQLPVEAAVARSLEVRRRSKGSCAICMERLDGRNLRLPCRHSFHVKCLSPWMQRRGSCPSCRAAVDAALHAAQKSARETWDGTEETEATETQVSET
ncbi:unnamed protein product [Effrenium voratum]|nr:unnamed protein product [Effrenium voratum]